MVKELKKKSSNAKKIKEELVKPTAMAFEEDKDDGVIDKNVFDIFNDNEEEGFEFELMAQKKKLLNQKSNTLADILKLKIKGLDMLILVMSNNKNVIKEGEIPLINELSLLLKAVKKEKDLFEPMMKRIKTLAGLSIKNYISIKKEDGYSNLCKFVIEIMNSHFENSFLQQVIDLLKADTGFYNIFIETCLKKVFCGRDLIIKNQDIRFIIKHSIQHMGIMYFINNLAKYLQEKDKGGARTNHQLNMVFNLIIFCFELFSSKQENKANSTGFHDITEDALAEFINTLHTSLKIIISEENTSKKNLNGEVQKTSNGSKQTKDAKANRVSLIANLINLFSRFCGFFSKALELKHVKANPGSKLPQKLKKFIGELETQVDSFNLKNLSPKITQFREKLNL